MGINPLIYLLVLSYLCCNYYYDSMNLTARSIKRPTFNFQYVSCLLDLSFDSTYTARITFIYHVWNHVIMENMWLKRLHFQPNTYTDLFLNHFNVQLYFTCFLHKHKIIKHINMDKCSGRKKHLHQGPTNFM